MKILLILAELLQEYARTDRHDEANICFSYFCEITYEMCHFIRCIIRDSWRV